MDTAQTVLAIGQVYLWIGAAVAAVFLAWGLDRIDPKGRGSWMFRPLLVPGILLIWPCVLMRWWALERQAGAVQAHYRPPLIAQRRLALVLIVVLPVAIIAALLLRQDGPLERPAELLQAAGEETASE